jgi:hypothetical protein
VARIFVVLDAGDIFAVKVPVKLGDEILLKI